MDASEQKKLLRQQLKAQRSQLSEEEKYLTSQVITDKLLGFINWTDIKSLHCYTPLESLAEIDSWLLLSAVWEQWPHITVATPLLSDKKSLASVTINSDTSWAKSEQGLPLPSSQTRLPADHQFDLVIVPTLGFDSLGYRLGYGGGYYDRFLANQSRAQTIGLCYEFGYISLGLPRERHDIPLKRIVTEKNNYSFV